MFYLAQIRGAYYWILLQDMEYYNKLEEPTDEENDMLDLAFGLTETLVPFAWTLQWEFFITFNLDFFLFKALRFNPMFGIFRSRLGCQVIAKSELDGIRLAIPAATRNFAVDGYVPKPH